jgi:D-alanyl-D-alanine carboxypeptidase
MAQVYEVHDGACRSGWGGMFRGVSVRGIGASNAAAENMGVGIDRLCDAMIAIALMVLAMLTGATAATAQQPRYAAFMIDANSREVLYANAADEARHPASLTKMMTLYLVFDALEAGRLRIDDQVPISSYAAAQPPSRLGLKAGQSLSVDNAISVTAVKSANDIAVALAEKVGGSVPNFVSMMNARAQSLGMRNTHFSTPSGLTDPANVTTARDLAILGLALVQRHPRYYRYFGERDFVWNRATLINHNHLLGKMYGMDGIKTGYTVDSGFTLAASAVRGDRRLIAVVLGEPSLVARNRDAQALLEAGFSVLDRRAVGQEVTVASVLPTLDHPALRVEPYVEQGASDEGAPLLAPRPLLVRAVERAPRPEPRRRAATARRTAPAPHPAARGHERHPTSKAVSRHGVKTSHSTAAEHKGKHHR